MHTYIRTYVYTSANWIDLTNDGYLARVQCVEVRTVLYNDDSDDDDDSDNNCDGEMMMTTTMLSLMMTVMMMTLMDIGVVSYDERVLCPVHPTQLCYGRG